MKAINQNPEAMPNVGGTIVAYGLGTIIATVCVLLIGAELSSFFTSETINPAGIIIPLGVIVALVGTQHNNIPAALTVGMVRLLAFVLSIGLVYVTYLGVVGFVVDGLTLDRILLTAITGSIVAAVSVRAYIAYDDIMDAYAEYLEINEGDTMEYSYFQRNPMVIDTLTPANSLSTAVAESDLLVFVTKREGFYSTYELFKHKTTGTILLGRSHTINFIGGRDNTIEIPSKQRVLDIFGHDGVNLMG